MHSPADTETIQAARRPARPLEVLLLCDFDPFQAQTPQDHIRALAEQMPGATVHVLSFRGALPEALDLERFDAVIVHFTTFIYEPRYLAPEAAARIAAYGGVKALFLQDEYKHVHRTWAAMRALRLDLLFSCIPEPALEAVYPEAEFPGLTRRNVLTGYVYPAWSALPPGPPIAARPVHLGYRGRVYPAWHGALGRERVLIAEAGERMAREAGLTADISLREQDRLYGARWIGFMQRCRAVLGSESGASVVDFTGEIARAVEAEARAAPDTPYEDLRARHFAAVENAVPMAQVSPRIFEAVACRTALVLYEGGYSGVVEPGRHFLPLRKDHGNAAEIADALRDSALLQAMADRAHADVIASGRYDSAAFAAFVGGELRRLVAARPARAREPYGRDAFIRAFGRHDSLWRREVLRRQAFNLAYRGYALAVRGLSPEREAALRGAIKRVWFRLRGAS